MVYAIPAAIVSKVVPVLIAKGSYTHPNLGLTGETLTPSIAGQVGLDTNQRGVLVISVSQGGPADLAGLTPTTQRMVRPGQVEISGGDVITALDSIAVNAYEVLFSFIFNETEIGQAVSLSISREGRELTLELTLAGG